MSGENIRTADGRVLTEAEVAVHKGIADRLSWASLHWGTEQVSPDAWPHIAIAATAAAESAVRAQVAAGISNYADGVMGLVTSPNGARLAFERIVEIARGDS